jgi:hypothetical protein
LLKFFEMKSISLLLFLLICSLQSFTQTVKTKAEKMLAYTDSINNEILTEGEYRNYYLIHEVNLESNRRAIGKQYTNIKFYYRQFQDKVVESAGGVDFIDIKEPPIKVTVDYNISASVRYLYEYYFNRRSELMYVSSLEITDSCRKEFLFYEKGKLIFVRNCTLTSCNREKNPTVKNINEENIFLMANVNDISKDFNAVQLKEAKKKLANAQQYLTMFDQLLLIEKTDK